jgi:hypothetical protein
VELDPYDHSSVYTAPGASAGGASPPCTHACAPGQFQYEIGTATGVGNLCSKCTAGICGAPDDGLSTARYRDGMQYTTACKATEDSKCVLCSSDDPYIRFTSNGLEIGAWCGFDCQPGYTACTPCAWDTARAVDVSGGVSGAADGPASGSIPFDQRDLFRFTGRVLISTAAFGTRVVLRVRVDARRSPLVASELVDTWEPPDGTGTVVELFPVVPSAALLSMTLSDASIQDAPVQVVDTTVDMSLLTNTPSFSQWNQARNSTGTVLHLFYALTVDSTAPQNVSVLQRTVHKMAREAGCCDQTTEQKCNRCTKTMGTNTTLPLHSHWTHGIGNESCAWACDLHYELPPHYELGGDGEVCHFCLQPSCPVGRYWTKCGECEDCKSTLPIHATFIGNGTTRYDPNSCPFKCAPDFYYNEIDEICISCRFISLISIMLSYMY